MTDERVTTWVRDGAREGVWHRMSYRPTEVGRVYAGLTFFTRECDGRDYFTHVGNASDVRPEDASGNCGRCVVADAVTDGPKDGRNAPLDNVLWGRWIGRGLWHVWVESEDDHATVKRACDAFEGDGLSVFVGSFLPGNSTRERRGCRDNCHTCDVLWSWFRFFDGKETGRDRKDDARRIERDALLAAKHRLVDENVSSAEKLRDAQANARALTNEITRLSARVAGLEDRLKKVSSAVDGYAEGTDGRTRYGYVQRTDDRDFPFRAVCTMCPGEGMTLVKRASPDNAVSALAEHVSRRHMGSVPVADDANGERYARCTVRGCSHSERSATIDVRKAIVGHEIREHGGAS